MTKIVHLSDLHIGFHDLGGRAVALGARLALNKVPAQDYVVVVTGDLVDDGRDEDALTDAEALVGDLREAGYRLLIVPGNHDVGGGATPSKSVAKRFLKIFFGDGDADFPRLDLINRTAFIGLNSMEAETGFFSGGWLAATGELGTKQLERLTGLLKEPAVRNADYRVLYLHHHPLDPEPRRELKDAKQLREVVQQHDLDALLFGHQHDGEIWNGSMGWERVRRIYDAGTSTSKRGKPHPHRVIDLSKDPSQDYDAKLISDSILRSTDG